MAYILNHADAKILMLIDKVSSVVNRALETLEEKIVVIDIVDKADLKR